VGGQGGWGADGGAFSCGAPGGVPSAPLSASTLGSSPLGSSALERLFSDSTAMPSAMPSTMPSAMPSTLSSPPPTSSSVPPASSGGGGTLHPGGLPSPLNELGSNVISHASFGGKLGGHGAAGSRHGALPTLAVPTTPLFATPSDASPANANPSSAVGWGSGGGSAGWPKNPSPSSSSLTNDLSSPLGGSFSPSFGAAIGGLPLPQSALPNSGGSATGAFGSPPPPPAHDASANGFGNGSGFGGLWGSSSAGGAASMGGAPPVLPSGTGLGGQPSQVSPNMASGGGNNGAGDRKSTRLNSSHW